MEPFDAFAESPELDLEAGAALVARDDNPRLTVADVIASLDQLAEGCPEVGHLPIEKAAAILADHLYHQLGFRGDDQTYGDPRNSRIDEVIARRRGIPITLAIVFLGLARRRGLLAHGVSFPGHFLVRVERDLAADAGGATRPLVLDPFHGGRPMEHADLVRLLRRATGPSARLEPKHLEPASTRAILVRLLQNLKAAHLARGAWAHALVAVSRIVALMPREPSPLRERGMLQAQLGASAGAREDLERYLTLAPDAGDVATVRQVLDRLAPRPALH